MKQSDIFKLKCICHDVELIKINDIINEYAIDSINQLRDKIKFGEKCKLCNYYIEELIKNKRNENIRKLT